MKKTKKGGWFIPILISLLIYPGCTGCSNEGNSDTQPYFRLSSEELEYDGNSKMHSKSVSLDESTYTINVESTPSVTWTAQATKGEDFITVKPTGKQTGNGRISIIVAANPEKKPREGIVSIQNSIDNIEAQIILRQTKKELYFPKVDPAGDGIDQETEDFYNPESRYNTEYMLEGDNIAILWAKEMGKDPRNAENNFDPKELMKKADDVFNYMKETLGFATLPNSKSDQYKFLIFVRNDNGANAGGGGRYPVPMLWISPGGMKDGGRILQHELCHSFQYLANYDGAPGFGGTGSFYEMTSQWSLLQRYPDWINQERSHFNDFMKQTHLALGCKDNQYHSPYMLQYWAEKHGVKIISRIWQETTENDQQDFIRAYMRLTETDQQTFNKEVYDAAAHFITWDLPHIDTEYNKYGGANVHQCELDKIGIRYQIAKTRCPRNYGYNGIKLTGAEANQTVTVKLTGLTNAEGFSISNKDRAEWRWGFVASLENGERVYSEYKAGKQGELVFTIPEKTKHLWLVVAATPTTYWFDESSEWPYQIELTNAQPDPEFCKVNE